MKYAIVPSLVKDPSDANLHVQANHEKINYHKPLIHFRFPTMSKGRKGGENEPKSGPGAAPPPAAPSQAPPTNTPPPKPTTGGQKLTVKPSIATGEAET